MNIEEIKKKIIKDNMAKIIANIKITEPIEGKGDFTLRGFSGVYNISRRPKMNLTKTDKEWIVSAIAEGIKPVSDKIDAVDAKVDAVEIRLTEKIDAVDAKVDAVEIRLTEKIDAVDAKVDAVDARLTSLESKVDKHIKEGH